MGSMVLFLFLSVGLTPTGANMKDVRKVFLVRLPTCSFLFRCGTMVYWIKYTMCSLSLVGSIPASARLLTVIHFLSSAG